MAGEDTTPGIIHLLYANLIDYPNS